MLQAPRSPILSKWQLPPSRGSGQRSWGIRLTASPMVSITSILPRRIQLLTILTTFISSLLLATITFVWNHLPGLSFLSLPEPRIRSALFTASVRSCPSVRWPAGSTHSGLPSLTSLIFSPTLCPSPGLQPPILLPQGPCTCCSWLPDLLFPADVHVAHSLPNFNSLLKCHLSEAFSADSV